MCVWVLIHLLLGGVGRRGEVLVGGKLSCVAGMYVIVVDLDCSLSLGESK